MDGSASTTSVASVRQHLSRNQANQSGRNATDAAVRNALFEQLLSCSVPVQTMPQVTEPVATPTDNVNASKKDSDPVDEKKNADSEADTESPVAPAIAIAVVDPKLPIQATQPNNTKNDLCSLPPKGNDKSSQQGQNANGQLTGQKVEASSAIVPVETKPIQSEKPIATKQPTDTTTVNKVETPIQPIADSGRKHTSHHAANQDQAPAQQTQTPANVPVVQPESPQRPHHDLATLSQQSNASNTHVSNAVQQADDAKQDSHRERWFERDADSKSPLSEIVESSEVTKPVDPTANLATPTTSTTLTPSIDSNANATPNAATSVAASDAAIASAIVQAQASSAAANRTPSTTASTAVEPARDTGSNPIGSNTIGTKPTQDSKSAKPTASENPKTELSQQERVRLVQRIARSFNRINAASGQINLRLHPEQLGALNVQVNVEGKSMSAKLTTETQDARDTILKELPVLRQRLAEQGFDVTKFQVEVAGHGAQANFGQSSGQSQSEQRSSQPSSSQIDYRRAASQATLASSPVVSFAPTSASVSTTGIDLQV